MFKPALFLLLAICASLSAQAAPGAGELKDVQQAIADTQQQIRQTTDRQQAVDAALNQTRQRLARAQAELNQLQQQQQHSRSRLQQLHARLDGLRTEIAGARAQVARLLNAHYRNRQPQALMLWLQQADAADKGRHLQYMRHLNRANARVIARLQQQQAQAAEQQKAVDAQLRQLAALQQRQQSLLSQLGQRAQQQQQHSRALENRLDGQKQQLAELRNNEKRLNRLVQQLAQQAAAKRKVQAEARRQAAQAAAAKPAPPPAAGADKTATPVPASTLTAEDLALQAPAGQHEIHQPSGFSRLQGQMRSPVNGRIAGRFGHGRPDGGTWKGLFIATAPATVHSIAAGDVAYAAPLQGYGNTVIIDHGDGYLSIYTGLSSVAVRPGNRVAARHGLGRSGNLPSGEAGLYFEIRYRNQAMNPLSWLG